MSSQSSSFPAGVAGGGRDRGWPVEPPPRRRPRLEELVVRSALRRSVMRQCVFSSVDLSPALGLRGETGVGSREGMAISSSLVRIAEMRHKWLDVYLGDVSN